MKTVQFAPVYKPLWMWGSKDLFYDLLSNSPVFSLAWLKLERMTFCHKEYCFSNRMVGLAAFFYWNS